jgi:1,4-dihydroxy-2-naphthoate octaprenyltransferase
LGQKKSGRLVALLLIFPYLLLGLWVAFGLLPFAALLPWSTMVWSAGLAVTVTKADEPKKIFSNLSKSFVLYVLFGLLLIMGLILDQWILA